MPSGACPRDVAAPAAAGSAPLPRPPSSEGARAAGASTLQRKGESEGERACRVPWGPPLPAICQRFFFPFFFLPALPFWPATLQPALLPAHLVPAGCPGCQAFHTALPHAPHTMQVGISLILSFMVVWDLPAIRRGVQSLTTSRVAPIYNTVAPSLEVFATLFGKALQAQVGARRRLLGGCALGSRASQGGSGAHSGLMLRPTVAVALSMCSPSLPPAVRCTAPHAANIARSLPRPPTTTTHTAGAHRGGEHHPDGGGHVGAAAAGRGPAVALRLCLRLHPHCGGDHFHRAHRLCGPHRVRLHKGGRPAGPQGGGWPSMCLRRQAASGGVAGTACACALPMVGGSHWPHRCPQRGYAKPPCRASVRTAHGARCAPTSHPPNHWRSWRW